MGGLVAFEMARELRRRGKAVALVALVDSWVPCLQPGATPMRLDDTLVLQGFALQLGQMAGHQVPLSTEALACCPREWGWR
jgi:thioesterase domain-containing protein